MAHNVAGHVCVTFWEQRAVIFIRIRIRIRVRFGDRVHDVLSLLEVGYFNFLSYGRILFFFFLPLSEYSVSLAGWIGLITPLARTHAPSGTEGYRAMSRGGGPTGGGRAAIPESDGYGERSESGGFEGDAGVLPGALRLKNYLLHLLRVGKSFDPDFYLRSFRLDRQVQLPLSLPPPPRASITCCARIRSNTVCSALSNIRLPDPPADGTLRSRVGRRRTGSCSRANGSDRASQRRVGCVCGEPSGACGATGQAHTFRGVVQVTMTCLLLFVTSFHGVGRIFLGVHGFGVTMFSRSCSILPTQGSFYRCETSYPDLYLRYE